ncbi:MAG: hypothetical protein R2771_03990 [Saprospiraceae bacterium]
MRKNPVLVNSDLIYYKGNETIYNPSLYFYSWIQGEPDVYVDIIGILFDIYIKTNGIGGFSLPEDLINLSSTDTIWEV